MHQGGNTGAIVDDGKGENKEYGAVTATTSKRFKALYGVERFIKRPNRPKN
jgi:hypothetical protein